MAGRHAAIEAKLAEAPASAEARLRIYLREFWELSLSPARLWMT